MNSSRIRQPPLLSTYMNFTDFFMKTRLNHKMKMKSRLLNELNSEMIFMTFIWESYCCVIQLNRKFDLPKKIYPSPQ